MTTYLSRISFAALATLFALSTLFVATPAGATSLTAPADLEAGDLIRGESFTAVYYYGEDGFRYVFPNSKTYFTWYEDFDDVKWLTDANLATIQIGGNVTYKPGVKMVKINSAPQTYAVGGGGILRHVATEAIAVALYGSNWNTMIDDVPDGFFSNYSIGSAVDVAGSFSPTAEKADAHSINADKGLKPFVTVTITDNAYSDEEVAIDAGTTVRFVNEGANKHTASADDKSWGTGTLAAGKHFTRRFKEAGSYDYHCAYHSGMTATIVVE